MKFFDYIQQGKKNNNAWRKKEKRGLRP